MSLPSASPSSPSPSTPTRPLSCITPDASAFITPEGNKKRAPSTPPVVPLKEKMMRMKENVPPTEDALLLISTEEGKVVTYTSNHPVLSEICGHHGDILQFYSDELFAQVLNVVGGEGYSPVNRGMCFSEEILARMKASLVRLFSEEMHGGGKAVDGQVFRGTIVIS